jgi:hypothetical protein
MHTKSFNVDKASLSTEVNVDGQTIKINHQLNLPSPPLKIVTYLTEIDSYNSSDKYYPRLHHL